MLNRVAGGHLPFRWSINPYRGCAHGCIYCYARATHPYLGLNGSDDFETILFVKTGVAATLRQELARPGWRREHVAIGTATDPYQPIEARYRVTRDILRALVEAGTPFSITTKGTLILRDLDLLVEATRGAGCTVNISVPTVDPQHWRRLEPGTPHPLQRLRVLRRLRDAGIHAGVFLAPILPGITDDEPHLEAVVRAAAQHGAAFLWAGVLHLGAGVREWVFPALARVHPQAVPLYRALYRGREAPSFYREQVLQRVARLQRKWGVPAQEPETPPGREDQPSPRPGDFDAGRGIPGRAPQQLSLPV